LEKIFKARVIIFFVLMDAFATVLAVASELGCSSNKELHYEYEV